MTKVIVPNMEATVVDIKVWDFDFLKESMQKLLEKAFNKTIDATVDELRRLGYWYYKTVRITHRELDGAAGDLLYVQGMVNDGWKALKQSPSVIIWAKK